MGAFVAFAIRVGVDNGAKDSLVVFADREVSEQASERNRRGSKYLKIFICKHPLLLAKRTSVDLFDNGLNREFKIFSHVSVHQIGNLSCLSIASPLIFFY